VAKKISECDFIHTYTAAIRTRQYGAENMHYSSANRTKLNRSMWRRSRERDGCVIGFPGFSAPAVVPVSDQVMEQTIQQRDRHLGACEDTCHFAKASPPADAHRVALVQPTNQNKERREWQIIE
jgi:hypothetical protein